MMDGQEDWYEKSCARSIPDSKERMDVLDDIRWLDNKVRDLSLPLYQVTIHVITSLECV